MRRLAFFKGTQLAVGQAFPLTPAGEKASLCKGTQLAVEKAVKNPSAHTPADEKASPFKDTQLTV